MRNRLIALAALAPVVAFGQQSSGSISGIVVGPQGIPLAGVIVDAGSHRQAATTGPDGRFRVARIAAGAQSVTYRYIGFTPVTRSVTVSAGATATDSVRLTEAVENLAAVTITGQVAGQAAALNQQRSAANITNVVDNELVGRLPDQNMADALQRLPGVAVDKDQGEGRYVQIRGTRPDMNALSVDGTRLPTPENSGSSVSGNRTSGRALPMDVIPSDQAASIQVSKTLTPDLDADAIGGNVNIVTRTARRDRTLNFSYATGRNLMYDRPIQNATANFGDRFGANGEFGVNIGATYYENSRASQNFEGSWCIQNGDCGPAGSASIASLDAPRLWETRNYPVVDRLRQGINTALDWNPNPNTRILLRGSLSSFGDAEIRFRQRYTFRAGSGSRWNMVSADSGTTTGSRMDRDIRIRELIWRMGTLQLSGEHSLFGGQQLDWAVATAQASDNRPNSRTLAFRQANMGFAYNFADAERPRVYTTVGNADDASRFAFQGLTREKRVIEDKDFNLRGNWTMPFGMSSGAGSLKFGAAARLKNRTNNINTTVSTTALGTNSLGATAANLFQTLVGTSAPVRIFDGFYSMGPQAQTKAAEDFINANPGAFTTDQFNSDLPTKGAYFKVKEDVYAGYVMASMDWGSFSLTPGARIEATRLSSDANKLAVSGTTLTATPITNSSTYTNFFPSVTANYRADEHTVFRAAVTTSMARPNFGDIVPSTRTTSGQNTATVGNAALKPTEALNLDLMAEKYFSTVGFVSLGVFHKSLKNFVYPQTRAPQAGEALPAEVTQVIEPVNGPTGTITGLEAAWQQALAFLPGALNGLGVNLNYTWTKSEATFPLRGSEKFSIPGQAGASANAGLSYDKGPLSLRTGLNYASKYRVTVSPVGKDADTYRLPHTQLDFSGSYQLFSNTKVFLEGINLTNEPYRGSVGDRDNRGGGGDDPSFEFYRPWWTLGFRIGN